MANKEPTFRERLISNAMTPQEMMDAQTKIKQREGLPILGNGYLGNLFGGAASSFTKGFADTAEFLNLKGVSDSLNKKAENIESYLKPAKPAELSFDYVFSPEGIMRGTGNATGSLASIALPSLIPEAGLPGTLARGANWLSKATKIAPETAKWAMRGAMTTPMESLMEAGNFERNAGANGMSPEEAKRRSWEVFGNNLAFLTASNALQFGMLPRLINGSRRWLAAGAELGTQAGEEAYQEAFHKKAMGEPYSYNPIEIATNPKYESQLQAAKEGAAGFAIPVLGGAAIGSARDRFRNKKQRDWVNEISGGEMSDEVYNSIVRNAEKLGYTPEQTKLALALATAESNGTQNVVSEAGAVGIMQLMPETAESLGVDPHNPEENIRGGLTYLKQMLDKYKGDWKLAASAYNAGSGAVDEYNGIPPYAETENYVDRIAGFLGESPTVESVKKTAEEKVDEPAGIYEGKYWKKQTDGVSYDGAKPETMKALDLLGEWFYEKTGKPLIVTAVTDGQHAQGERGHHAGWKVDVNDYGSGAEGSLTTEDFQKGYLADEFIKYGQSLGLGMNFEGAGTENVHFDISVLGDQWEGEFAGQNFGGLKLNGKKSADKTPSVSSSDNENDNDKTIDEIIKNLLSREPDAQINFDATRDRNLERAIYPLFVEDIKNNSEGLNFLEENEMLKKDGTFKNTKDNREVLRKEFAEELEEFGKNKVAERYNRYSQNQKSAEEKIRAAFESLVKREEDEGKPESVKHRQILQDGKISETTRFLKDAGIEINSTSTPSKSQSEDWTNFDSEIQKRFIRYLSDELTTSGNIDESLGRGLENGDAKSISDALKVLRKSRKENLARQIAESEPESLTDEGKKFRESYLELQEKMNQAEQSRLESLAGQERANLNGNVDIEALQKFDDAEKNIKTLRAEIEKLTPSKNFKIVSEVDEMTRLEREYKALENRLADESNIYRDAADETEKSKSRDTLLKLWNQMKANRKSFEEVQDRYDAKNDIGEIWRNSAREFSFEETQNLLAQGIEQSNRAIQRATKKFDAAKKSGNEDEIKSAEKELQKATAQREKLMFAQENQGDTENILSEVYGDSKGSPKIELNEDYQSANQSKTPQEVKQQPIKTLSPLEQANKNLSELKTQFLNAVREEKDAVNRNDYDAVQSAKNKQSELRTRIDTQNAEILKLQSQINSQSPQEDYQSANPSKTLQEVQIEIPAKRELIAAKNRGNDKLIGWQREYENLHDKGGKLLAQLMSAQNNGETERYNELKQMLAENAKKMAETKKAIERLKPNNPVKTSTQETPKNKGVEGNTSQVTADNNREYKTRFKVAEADEVIPSHYIGTFGMDANKNYPSDLQPRNREGRQTYSMNALRRANNLNPSLLMDSQNVNQGAPIVRSDGVVLNGNGRTASIYHAYKNGKANDYRQAIIENAEQFGLNRDEILEMKNPVLVREMTGELSGEDLKSITESKTGGESFGASEKAEIDAEKISDATLKLYVDNENGDLTTVANREFVQSALNDIAGKNEINAYTQGNGEINADGIIRVKRALFALAYYDDGLIARFSESTEDNIRKITNALTNAAIKIAQVKRRM